MANQEIDNYWLSVSDISINDAAIWMGVGEDPLLHEQHLQEDKAYEEYYISHPGGMDNVNVQYALIESAIRAGRIEVTKDKVLNKKDEVLSRTRILKSGWIDWLRENNQSELADILSHSVAAKSNSAPQSQPLMRQPYQEQEILRVIKELGHDPKNLPKDNPGKSGIKAAVKSKLPTSMTGTTIFNKAWDRLSGANEIVKLK